MRYFSAASERNKEPIFRELAPHLKECTSVLEIGCGTAQHCLHAFQQFPKIEWHCSDQARFLASAKRNLEEVSISLATRAIAIDVNSETWLDGSAHNKRFSAVYTANTLHIMDASSVRNFFAGLPHYINESAKLFVYGPFQIDKQFTSESNADFDATLRARGVGSCIKDLGWIETLAQRQHLVLKENIFMPANNQLLIFEREERSSNQG